MCRACLLNNQESATGRFASVRCRIVYGEGQGPSPTGVLGPQSGPLARLPPRSGCSAYGRATGTSASRPHSPGVRLSLRGPLNKKRRCGCNGVEYVVEVRRVELLSTTANREVSPGSVGSQNGERSVKRQTSRTPAGSILACGIPATSASAIPLNDLAPAPGIERRIEGAELN